LVDRSFFKQKTTWNANAAGGNPSTAEGRRFFENGRVADAVLLLPGQVN
jgi:hypothetical protein